MFESECMKHSPWEKDSMVVYSSSVQTTGVLKRSSGHKQEYPLQFKHPLQIAATQVLGYNPPCKNNIRCESNAMRGL